MDTRITGIIHPGDTRDIQEWLENRFPDQSGLQTDVREIRADLAQLIQQQQMILDKVSRIEVLLQKR